MRRNAARAYMRSAASARNEASVQQLLHEQCKKRAAFASEFARVPGGTGGTPHRRGRFVGMRLAPQIDDGYDGAPERVRIDPWAWQFPINR